MPRCPVCGVRVSALCPSHGPVESSPATHPPEAPALAGWSVTGYLGGGGFGNVFAATRERDGLRAAIKIALTAPTAVERLEREALALAAIGPPHVPTFVALDHAVNGARYLAMELVAAPTLAAEMERGVLGVAGVAATAPAILDALAAAHARGFVHRDLKPENIFVEVDPRRARLFDFGLARQAEESADAGLTRADTLVGTAEYMAPEQCTVGATVDGRADIYAVGVILYEMLTGRPPFLGSDAEVQHGHRRLRPARPSELAPLGALLEEVVLRCLAKDAERRYPDVAALSAALRESLAESAPAPVKRAAPAAPARPERQRRSIALLVLASGEIAPANELAAGRGGVVVHASGDRTVVVFDAEAGASPVQRALDAARDALSGGLCERALVDLAVVSVLDRPDGSRRYSSAQFERAALPAAAGVTTSQAALEALGEGAGLEVAPLTGREELLGRLERLATEAGRRNLPTVTWVLADAGHGKSRLHEALNERLGAHLPTITLRARDPVDGVADETLRALLRLALAIPAPPPPPSGRLALLEAALGNEQAVHMWPGVALALGWIDVDAPEIARLGAAPGALRAAAARAAGLALRRRAAHAPLAVLLDDAQFADEASLDALEYAALAEAAAPIFVCALARPRFAASRPGWGERAAVHERLSVGPLDPVSADALCRKLLLPADDVPARAVDLLLARSQSIPLLLVELVRALRREGLVRQRARGGRWYVVSELLDKVPDVPLVEWSTQQELEGLSAELAMHARLASLLGATLTVTEVEGVVRELERRGSGGFRLDAAAALRRLAASGLLRAMDDGGFAFRHALVREAVARSASPEVRDQVHRAAELFYREASGMSEDSRLPQLAHHAANAGLRASARDAYFELAERARGRHAYLDAEMLYSRAITHLELDDPIAYRALHGRGRMRYRLARYEDAIADLAGARDIAERRNDAAAATDILLDEATAFDWMGDFSTSLERVQRAQARAAGSATPELEAQLSLGLGRSMHRFSRDAEACTLLARAVATAEALGDRGHETLVIANLILGGSLPLLGRLDEAEAALERVIAVCTARDDRLHVVAAINNRAFVRGYRGDQAGMMADWRRVLELARELGQPTMELMGQFNLGEFFYLIGELDEARVHVQRAVELERRQVGDLGRPLAVILEARFRLGCGEVDAARDIAAAIRKQQADARAAERHDALLVPAEDVLCRAVELATRTSTEDEWQELASRSAQHSVGQDRIEVLAMKAAAERRAGRFETARKDLREALLLCDRISNVMRARLAGELESLSSTDAR